MTGVKKSPGILNRETRIRSIWHNKTSPEKLMKKIRDQEKKALRSTAQFNVIQAQTTPGALSAVKKIGGSIATFGKKGGLKTDAKASLKHQEGLVSDAKDDKDLLRAINIFMVDHVDPAFAQIVIDLNRKKLELNSF